MTQTEKKNSFETGSKNNQYEWYIIIFYVIWNVGYNF